MKSDSRKSLWQLAKNYARKKGEDNDCEDFAQYASLELFKGRKASIKQMFVDYIRVKYGADRTGKPGIRNRPHTGHVMQLKDKTPLEPTIVFRDMVKVFSKKLYGKDKSIFLLYFYYGMSTPEIAVVLGNTNSGVSIRLKNILGTIQVAEKFRKIVKSQGQKSNF